MPTEVNPDLDVTVVVSELSDVIVVVDGLIITRVLPPPKYINDNKKILKLSFWIFMIDNTFCCIYFEYIFLRVQLLSEIIPKIY